jgi:hypothetical protein
MAAKVPSPRRYMGSRKEVNDDRQRFKEAPREQGWSRPVRTDLRIQHWGSIVRSGDGLKEPFEGEIWA